MSRRCSSILIKNGQISGGPRAWPGMGGLSRGSCHHFVLTTGIRREFQKRRSFCYTRDLRARDLPVTLGNVDLLLLPPIIDPGPVPVGQGHSPLSVELRAPRPTAHLRGGRASGLSQLCRDCRPHPLCLARRVWGPQVGASREPHLRVWGRHGRLPQEP